MVNQDDLFGYASLGFFGKVNASISHELKNVMAIISETAGLLKDLAEMAGEGQSVPTDMLTSSVDSIVEEIQRGFSTIRQMNRFAHSVDHPVGTVNLMEVLDLVCNLSGYLSYAGKTRLNSSGDAAPTVETCPFILHSIVYQVVVQAFQHTGPQGELEIFVQTKDDSTWCIFVYGFSAEEYQVFPEEDLKKMAASIGVSILWDRSSDRLEIDVPTKIV